MAWSNIVGLTGGALIVFFALLRVERKRLWVVALVLVLPSVWLTVIWANFYHRWPEVLIGVGAAGLMAGGWWLAYGRRLPPATSDAIKVWGQEEMPKARPQHMQAELQRLREEKERLEAELRRLRSGGNGHGQDQ